MTPTKTHDLTPVLIALVIATGCSTHQRVAAVGAGLATFGTLRLASDYEDDQDSAPGKLGTGFLIAGLLTMFAAGAVDESVHDKSEPVVFRRDSQRQQLAEKNRLAAWQLTKVAQAAARRDECDRVTRLDVQVRELDHDLHTMAFARDIAIQRCLAAATSAPGEPPAPVEPPAPATPAPDAVSPGPDALPPVLPLPPAAPGTAPPAVPMPAPMPPTP